MIRTYRILIPILSILVVSGCLFSCKTKVSEESPVGVVQLMEEIEIMPNLQDAEKAIIPAEYGALKGVENVGSSTMLWFESSDGTIRRINVSFWEDEIILDNRVVVINRR